MVIWSMCFMGSGMSDGYTAAMGLSFTFLSVYFFQQKYRFQVGFWGKAAILAFPVLYGVATYVTLASNGYFSEKRHNAYQMFFYIHLINPVNIALLVLVLGLTRLKDLSKPVNIFIFVYITLFYAYIFHWPWMVSWAGQPSKSFDTEKSKSALLDADMLALDTTQNLSKFKFVGPNLDTLTLQSRSGKFVLLETWNETCFPCIRAMDELPDFYAAVEDRMDVYYVYENSKERVRSEFGKIFSFEKIKDKSKIRIDIGQSLYDGLGMQGFPYFLLFDSEGKLVYHCRGYIGKDALSKQIWERIY